MSIPTAGGLLSLPPINVNFALNFSNVFCCTGGCGCCGGSTPTNVNIPLSNGKTASLPHDTKMVLNVSSQGEAEDTKKTFTFTKAAYFGATDEEKRTSFASLYDSYVEHYGKETTAITTTWKGLDFVSMYQSAENLYPITLSACDNAFQVIKPYKKSLDWTVEKIKTVLSENLITGGTESKATQSLEGLQAIIKLVSLDIESEKLQQVSKKLSTLQTNGSSLQSIASAHGYTPITQEEASFVVTLAQKIHDKWHDQFDSITGWEIADVSAKLSNAMVQ